MSPAFKWPVGGRLCPCDWRNMSTPWVQFQHDQRLQSQDVRSRKIHCNEAIKIQCWRSRCSSHFNQLLCFHPKSAKAKKRKSAFTCFAHPFFFSFELLLAPSFSLPLLQLLLSHRPSALVKRAISLQQARRNRMIINSLVKVY